MSGFGAIFATACAGCATAGTTAVAILLLALGIGANTAIFSLVMPCLRRPLGGVAEPDRLVRFVSIRNGQQQFNFGYPDYVDYRDRTRLLSGVAAESFASVTFPANPPLLIRASVVSGNFFSVLGVKPAMGRLFTAEDDRIVGGHPVVVIGHGLWQRAFGGDPGAIGKTLVLNGFNFTLVGAAAAGVWGSGHRRYDRSLAPHGDGAAGYAPNDSRDTTGSEREVDRRIRPPEAASRNRAGSRGGGRHRAEPG